MLYWCYPYINCVDFAVFNSYDIGELQSSILTCLLLDSIHYIFSARGDRQCKLCEHFIHAVYYTNYIYIPSEEKISTCTWLLLNQPKDNLLDILVYRYNLSTTTRPAMAFEAKHRYLPWNAVSNRANTLAGPNLNPAAQPKAIPILMNGTTARGSQSPQDSQLCLPV